MTPHEQALAKLEEMQWRADAATPGPWRLRYNHTRIYRPNGKPLWPGPEAEPTEATVEAWMLEALSNAAFISSVRTDAPKLIAALKGVLEIHRADPPDDPHCEGCERLWPCPTVRAIAEALK